MSDRRRQLLRSGFVLCLLALVTGLLLPLFANPRMALAAHVGGLMNGLFLIVAGLAWSELELGERTRTALFWGLLAGTFGNWASVTAAAAWGTRSLTPIAGAGFGAGRGAETVVTVGLLVVGVAMLAATAALVAGLGRRR